MLPFLLEKGGSLIASVFCCTVYYLTYLEPRLTPNMATSQCDELPPGNWIVMVVIRG
jgi:hypothetical protein